MLKPFHRNNVDTLPLTLRFTRIFLFWQGKPGIHQLDVHDLNFHFSQVKIQLLEEAMDSPKCLEYVYLGSKKQSIPYPLVLTAHASVQGAVYGGERTVMLGRELVLPGSLVKDPRLDYVALGHIHKPQNLNENAHPPVIYPGSIERVDFGEVEDDKLY